ncbi:hypothetical protein COV12_03500 [Candidatus Woesearchaeota archaeon CG10_big_fil_rev_8_21_14_0_10_32_24]|nr:MAG: hypothetical protein COV12_03500 [Candidatus Woesearchaeota archaeon CG10_big_fil_rev_8_21_14_0_10_32_24]
MKFVYLTEGSRVFLNSLKSRIHQKKYKGNAEEICRQVIDDCWNERYFQTSTGNFKQFWTRDFGWCVSSLLKLDYEKQVHQTIRYAFNRFKSANKITTTITPRGKPFDFPTLAVDSLPWFIHALKVSKFQYYEHKDFLNKEILVYFKKVINEQTGLVKPDEHFSSMKDLAVRKSSCYDNCMVGMLADDLKSLKLVNPFAKFNYPDLIKRHFWNGEYFYDDLTKKEYVAGDANIFPFLTGLIKDQDMLEKALKKIEEEELDKPFPLKYTSSREHINYIWEEFFNKDYESTALWQHMGPLYVRLVKEVNPDKGNILMKNYLTLIEKHQNVLEVFAENGKPHRTPFYYSDSGMLWAANYLTL